MSEQEVIKGTVIQKTAVDYEKANASLLLAIRICLLTLALCLATIFELVLESKLIPENYIFIPLAVLFGISAVSAFYLKKKKVHALYTHVHLLIDLLTVSGAIYLTGAAGSPLLFLYLPLIMAAALLLSRSATITFVGISVATYTAMNLLLVKGFIRTADNGPVLVPSGGLLLHITGLASGMVLIAVLSSYLKKTMRASFDDAQQSRRDFEVLSGTQRELEEKLAMQDRMARLLADQNITKGAAGDFLSELVGESAIMQKVYTLIEKVATADATVLISGESGTGKELVARAIHFGKNKPKSPFVAVNCGAIPENLIESQLFGHKKGAFTGADSDFTGLFLQADGGTIFLDEIGELPLLMQTKLLRVIQEKTLRPIGGTKDIPIDVRIVAATNRNLKREVEEGNFREDLFYRLNVISIKIPPLRSRKEDIPLLVRSIIHKLLPEGKQAVIAPGTMDQLMAYDYPGNVRELENVLERAIVLGGEVILPEHLPSHLREHISSGKAETQIIIDETICFPVHLEQILSTLERRYLEAALIQSKGGKKKAAELLGINFRSLRYRLQKFGIETE